MNQANISLVVLDAKKSIFGCRVLVESDHIGWSLENHFQLYMFKIEGNHIGQVSWELFAAVIVA